MNVETAAAAFVESAGLTTGANAAAIDAIFAETRRRLQTAHDNHLGYPYNLPTAAPVPAEFSRYLINNLGDPYTGSHYASELCALEREAIAWLMELWACADPADYWGSIGASGTEGNFWALYLAREALPGARLIYTQEAHYSIPKSARILRMGAVAVDCDASGALDIAAFRRALAAEPRSTVIVALTCGTTVKGAHDDIAAAMACLDEEGFDRQRRFVHVDGALNAMVLPFVDEAPAGILPRFTHGFDSLSTSGHKMIGTPMPCGALVVRRAHVERIASAIAYLRSNDTTLMGSRNGHAVLALWVRLIGHGREGFAADTQRCLDGAARLAVALRAAGVPVLHNPHSLTVVFPQPSESVVLRYQLACHHGEAHAIIMPNVTTALIDRFAADYLDWWSHRNWW